MRSKYLLIVYLTTLTGVLMNKHAVSQEFTQESKTRVYYSVFVQSFYDSNGDGIGDLPGLTSKLDYIQDLGITGLYLLPVHPSPPTINMT